MLRRLICITKNGTNPAYEGARIGASRVAEAAGFEIRHAYPEKPDDIEEQAALIRSVVREGADALLLAPAHPSALDAAIAEVLGSGIPMVYFVSRSDALEARTFVTADNYRLAHAIARYLVSDLGGRGDFVLVEGSLQSATSAPRSKGFVDAVSEYPDARIVARCCGNYQREDARRTLSDLLDRTPEIDGIICANDYMAMGVRDAMDAASRQVAITGINAMPQAIEAIKAGLMRATVAFDAMKMCAIAAEAAVRILDNRSVPAVIELPAEIVDAQNLAAWDLSYQDRPLLNWDQVCGPD